MRWSYILYSSQRYLQIDDVHETVAHSHAPDSATVEAEKVATRMRRVVRTNVTVRPNQVMASELHVAPPQARAAIGQRETVYVVDYDARNEDSSRVNQKLLTNLSCRIVTRPPGGHAHPSIWTLLQALQHDQALAATDLLQDARGQPPKKRIKLAYKQHQQRLLSICADRRDGKKSVEETLQALGHCIRLM